MEDEKVIITDKDVYLLAYNTPQMNEEGGTGLTPKDDSSELKDREVNVILSRDDDGCKDAYENCSDVFNNVERKVSILNSGIIVGSSDKTKFQKQIKYLEKRRDELELDSYIDFMLTNRELYSLGALSKKIFGNKIEYLVGISTMRSSRIQYEFIPIINSSTGRFGMEKIDPEDEKKVVVAVQKAVPVAYDAEANDTPEQVKTSYLKEDVTMIICYSGAGMVGKTASPVRRALRYAEGLMRLENTVLLLARRPTQLIYTAGNENHNLMNAEVPESYISAANNDRVQAKINYKRARLVELTTQAKNLTAGNVLAQVLEYGTSVAAIEVPEGLPYVDYMKYMAEKIKMCILAVDVPTQRIVRSATQEVNPVIELVEKAQSEQRKIKNSINKHITPMLLKEIGDTTVDDVWYEFAPIQKETKEDKARYWFYLARATDYFANSGIGMPEEFEQLLGEVGIKLPKPKPKVSDNKQDGEL